VYHLAPDSHQTGEQGSGTLEPILSSDSRASTRNMVRSASRHRPLRVSLAQALPDLRAPVITAILSAALCTAMAKVDEPVLA